MPGSSTLGAIGGFGRILEEGGWGWERKDIYRCLVWVVEDGLMEIIGVRKNLIFLSKFYGFELFV